jgi:hypothetical protein
MKLLIDLLSFWIILERNAVKDDSFSNLFLLNLKFIKSAKLFSIEMEDLFRIWELHTYYRHTEHS